MGYTHYFTPKKATQEKWNEFLHECKELHKNLPEHSESAGGSYNTDKIIICGGMGTGKPEFSDKMVRFNGKDDLSHETLSCSPDDMDWNFCKTARKPYDLLVCAVLIAAHNILGYNIRSDGNLKDWKPVIDYYSKVIYDESIFEMEDDLIEFILPEFLSNEIL